MLKGAQRRAEIMGTVGPKLEAAKMHRWVWIPAAELWDDGHRREAVQAAATSIFDQQLPAKLGRGRHRQPGELVGMAFSTKAPEPDSTRRVSDSLI